MNTNLPDIALRKTVRGGITINSAMDLDLDEELVKALLAEYKIHNTDLLIRERITLDELIDVIMGKRKYIRALTIINKIDLVDSEMLWRCKKRFSGAFPISAALGINIGTLRERIYHELEFMRIYMKPWSASADMENPLAIKRDSTVADVRPTMYRGFVEKFRYTRIWDKSAKYGGQRVGLSYVLADEDVVSIVTRK